MKLTDKTTTVLKNFSNINPSIVLVPGKVQSTIEIDGSILSITTLDQEFPSEAPIYDLPQFLSNISLMDDPELTFHEKYVEIEDKQVHVLYYLCKKSLVVVPPENAADTLAITSPEAKFRLSNNALDKLIKIASLNGLATLGIEGKNGAIYVKTRNKESDTSHVAKSKIGDYTGNDFSVDFKIENLRMIPDDYDVEVDASGRASFVNKDKTLTYFIATDI